MIWKKFQKICTKLQCQNNVFVVKAWKIFSGYWYFVRTWRQMAHDWCKTGWEIGRCSRRKGGRIKAAHQENHLCKVIPDWYAETEPMGECPRENTKVTEKWHSESLCERTWNLLSLRSCEETNFLTIKHTLVKGSSGKSTWEQVSKTPVSWTKVHYCLA